ncbi:MAG: hypothetical protein ACLTZT_15970, partial [Butyricimonas faecalis]
MQSSMQNISPIKQRILQFVANLGISKREFYSLTGISRGTLESKTGITEDTLTKLFTTYPNLSPIWIFTGKGEKFQSQQDEIPTYFAPEQNIEDKLLCIIAKDSEIELAEEVGKLKQEILQLKNSYKQKGVKSSIYLPTSLTPLNKLLSNNFTRRK